MLQGRPEARVWTRNASGDCQISTATVAIQNSPSLKPLTLGPKEGLAIVNGTAVSSSVGVLALHDGHALAILAQILTAMGVEAVCGSAESFDPFLSSIRPHRGQMEASRNIMGFLKGSKLAVFPSEEFCGADEGDLRQDRYSFRTVPQWLGPQLETLLLAHSRLTIEINSTTDNPVFDTAQRRVVHGGNFQAMAVTLAVEEVRTAAQAIGRMLFAQCTELINPATNNGLPPNLTADEPSTSFLFKGIDINIASIQAELGLISASVLPHVQSAEMNNQSLNSLALISARYTHTALDLLSQLSAAYLLTVCQALDLRALHVIFLRTLKPILSGITHEMLGPVVQNVGSLFETLWNSFSKELKNLASMDSPARFSHVFESLQTVILSHTSHTSIDVSGLVAVMRQWIKHCTAASLETYLDCRANYAAKPDPSEFIGSASNRMYCFVRRQLGVFFRAPLGTALTSKLEPEESPAIGSSLSDIHEAIRNGALIAPIMECLREVLLEV